VRRRLGAPRASGGSERAALRRPAAGAPPRRLVDVVAAALAALGLPLLSGCGSGQASGEVTRQETASATGLSAVSLATDNASIVVDAADQPEVSVSVRVRASGASSAEVQQRLDAVRLALRPDGGTLRVELELPPNRASAESYTLRVPANLALDLKTTNGSVKVSGVRGALDVQATNGAIDVGGTAGPATLQTTNGAINVRLAAGAGASLDLETTNGAISAPGAQGGRRVQTTVGPGGPVIKAHTNNGSISVSQGS